MSVDNAKMKMEMAAQEIERLSSTLIECAKLRCDMVKRIEDNRGNKSDYELFMELAAVGAAFAAEAEIIFERMGGRQYAAKIFYDAADRLSTDKNDDETEEKIKSKLN